MSGLFDISDLVFIVILKVVNYLKVCSFTLLPMKNTWFGLFKVIFSDFVIWKQKFITVVINGPTWASCFSADTWYNEMKPSFLKWS